MLPELFPAYLRETAHDWAQGVGGTLALLFAIREAFRASEERRLHSATQVLLLYNAIRLFRQMVQETVIDDPDPMPLVAATFCASGTAEDFDRHVSLIEVAALPPRAALSFQAIRGAPSDVVLACRHATAANAESVRSACRSVVLNLAISEKVMMQELQRAMGKKRAAKLTQQWPSL